MPLYEKLEVYRRAMDLSTKTWQVVRTWPYFHKDTLGRQMVRAADSIPANIAEGQGRFTFKERVRFCYYSRGGLYEYETQLRIALSRNLINEAEHSEITRDVSTLARLLNGFIAHLKQRAVTRPAQNRSRPGEVESHRRSSVPSNGFQTKSRDSGPSP